MTVASGSDAPTGPGGTPDGGGSDGLRWTDDHCHVHHRGAAPEVVAEQVAAARAAGVTRMITVGCSRDDSRHAIAAAEAHDGVFATVGVHPHEAKDGLEGIEELLDEPGVVAVGECGLDHYYDHSPREAQREVFAAQVAMAFDRDLALVIHTRDAWDDTFDVLAATGVPERTVFHCFTGGPVEARRCLDLGAMLSFSGIVTFKQADDLRAAAALCPLDRVLVETDSPYLTPVPHRGQRNRPALVPLVGAAVAEAQGREVAAVAEATWHNATRTYRLPT